LLDKWFLLYFVFMGRCLVLLVLVFVLVVPVVSAQEEVSSCSGLQSMGDDLDGDYFLGSDVDCSGFDFEPVAEGSDSFFEGVLDGRGHVVSGLEIRSDVYVGLFQDLKGEVRNISFRDVNVSGDSSVGVVAGSLEGDALVSGVMVSGSVQAERDVVGGIAAMAKDDAVVKNSFFRGTVKGASSGGIVGVSLIGDAVVNRTVSVADVEGGESGSIIGMAGWPEGLKTGSPVIVDSYWNSDLAGEAVGVQNDKAAVENLVSLSSSEMRGESAKENMGFLDFGGVWETTSSYPEIVMPDYSQVETDDSVSGNASDSGSVSNRSGQVNNSSVSSGGFNVSDRSNETVNRSLDGRGNGSFSNVSDAVANDSVGRNQSMGGGVNRSNESLENGSDGTVDQSDSGDRSEDVSPGEDGKTGREVALRKLEKAEEQVPESNFTLKAEEAFESGEYDRSAELASKALEEGSKPMLSSFQLLMVLLGATFFIMMAVVFYFVDKVYQV
jgi:hypothetical protein